MKKPDVIPMCTMRLLARETPDGILFELVGEEYAESAARRLEEKRRLRRTAYNVIDATGEPRKMDVDEKK
jgi:hypothetical protein